MFAGECNLADRHDAPTRTGRSDAATKSRRAQNASGNDPATNNADPTRDWAAEAISDHLDASDSSIRGHHWIIKVDDHDAIIGDAICEKSLDTAIRANAAMSIEVIDGHVRKHTNINSRVQ
jgi:hypothetical protein